MTAKEFRLHLHRLLSDGLSLTDVVAFGRAMTVAGTAIHMATYPGDSERLAIALDAGDELGNKTFRDWLYEHEKGDRHAQRVHD